MAAHSKDKPNPKRFLLLNESESRMDRDGVNNLKYEVVSLIKTKLFTKILVTYDESSILNEFNQTRESPSESKVQAKHVLKNASTV